MLNDIVDEEAEEKLEGMVKEYEAYQNKKLLADEEEELFSKAVGGVTLPEDEPERVQREYPAMVKVSANHIPYDSRLMIADTATLINNYKVDSKRLSRDIFQLSMDDAIYIVDTIYTDILSQEKPDIIKWDKFRFDCDLNGYEIYADPIEADSQMLDNELEEEEQEEELESDDNGEQRMSYTVENAGNDEGAGEEEGSLIIKQDPVVEVKPVENVFKEDNELDEPTKPNKIVRSGLSLTKGRVFIPKSAVLLTVYPALNSNCTDKKFIEVRQSDVDASNYKSNYAIKGNTPNFLCYLYDL